MGVSRTEDASGGQVLLLARRAFENASRTTVSCPQSVESAVLRAFENASRAPQEPFFVAECLFRTVGGRFRYRISLPYRRSLFFTPNASENASRTGGSLFEHRMRIPYRRSLFLVRRASENASHLVVRSTGKLPPQRNFELYKKRGRP